MTDAKTEYFKFQPTYEAKIWTESWSLDYIDEFLLKSDVEFSIVENEGKQGLIRTIINYDEDSDRYWWEEEGLFPCIYDKIEPLGVRMGVGVFVLKNEVEIKVVLMKAVPYLGGDEVVSVEVVV